MGQSVKDLQGEDILADDGRIGLVDDVYFDDERWGVRYFVADTGGWLPGKRVLLSPASVDPEGSGGNALRVKLTREQVERAPDAESDRPISRQYEIRHAAHFGYPYYWGGPLLWGMSATPAGPHGARPSADPSVSPGREDAEAAAQRAVEEGDAHLRSSAEVIGYDIEARDGSLGEVEDFIVDEKTWGIRDVVIDTTKWWPGGHVRISPDDVERIDWENRTMHVRLTRDELKRAARA